MKILCLGFILLLVGCAVSSTYILQHPMTMEIKNCTQLADQIHHARNKFYRDSVEVECVKSYRSLGFRCIQGCN